MSESEQELGLPRQVLAYLQARKRYWLLPMILFFAVFFGLVLVTETIPILSPFVYVIF